MSNEPTDPQHNGDVIEPGPEEESLAGALVSDRPVPGADFRGALGRYLAARDPGYGPRPDALRMMVLAYVAAGLVLIAIGLLQATGSL